MSEPIEEKRESQIRAAIGWANPQQRIRDVRNLIEQAEEDSYKRGFKEAEEYYKNELGKLTPKEEIK